MLAQFLNKKLARPPVEEPAPEYSSIVEKRKLSTIRSVEPGSFNNFYFMLDPMAENLPGEVDSEPYSAFESRYWHKPVKNVHTFANSHTEAA